MIIVGLTGGIGSGKSTVAKAFKLLGIPIYIADDEAKKLMNKSKVIRKKLIALFGEEAYVNNKLNRNYLADIIFKDKERLQQMNAIVHPRVAQHFNKWVEKQNAPYVIKEAAIMFENGGYKFCDFVITVVAPKDLRISRLLKRDATSIQKINAIIKNQWSDAQKVKLSNFVITNIKLEETKNQVRNVHNQIISKIS